MVIASTDIALFPFIEPGHPFHPHVERFRDAISGERRCADLLGRTAGPGRTLIHAEIKGRTEGQGWALDRFYWSLQAWGAASAPSDFAALTLVYAAKDDRLTWHTFPDDPYLTAMAASVAPCDERSTRPLRRYRRSLPSSSATSRKSSIVVSMNDGTHHERARR